MTYYVGIQRESYKRQLLNCIKPPDEMSYGGQYAYIVGPFRTKRGALFMLRNGALNPHCQSVDQAEHLASL